MRFHKTTILFFLILLVVACSGGSSTDDNRGTGASFSDCNGFCADTPTSLSVADVEIILAQAVQEAQSQGQLATIAVVDRVGNVLAVYRMGDALARPVLIATSVDINGDAIIDSGLEGIKLPTAAFQGNIDDQAAISKAITAAYLSSEGNAFSTRTASQIVQENFNPGEVNQVSGPLFGVQFSQLSCSDFTFDSDAVTIGPKRSPLGLSADPGGLPLYKNGTVVGGIGVLADGLYSIDQVVVDKDRDIDEMIAIAGTFNYAAPADRRADKITVDGKTLRFSDADFDDIMSDPELALSFNSIDGSVGTLLPVSGYTNGIIKAGVAFGQSGSGIRPNVVNFPGQDAFVFVDGTNAERFSPSNGTDTLLVPSFTATEVLIVLQEALTVANSARSQIRRPLGSYARVTIAVVDTRGEILGMVRSRDAPIFSADVSVQKARTAAFLSSENAAGFIAALPDSKYIDLPENTPLVQSAAIALDDYVSDLRTFIGDPAALSNGAIAFTDRASGNLSRPFYPDGVRGNVNGPLSKPKGSWSVFSTGMQLDLIINAIFQHVFSVATGGVISDVTDNCVGVNFDVMTQGFTATTTSKQLANGSQIFAGSVPIYRGNTLIGAIGVSGDGIDQDDLIAFLGVHAAAQRLNGVINNAPVEMRADNLTPQGIRLRYVQCPFAPLLNVDDDNVCNGK